MPTLNWIGKQAVEKHHLEIPYRLLEYDESLSAGDQESGNLLIQGDNLHALKALLPYYAGKVKCIYIDPPYNTGNEGWRYNDNVNSPEIKQWLADVVGKEDEDLSRHDKWLCMMYPRLQLLKKLLRKDGIIFISIDDNVATYLKLLLDEIFGRQNFVQQIVWKNKYGPGAMTKGFGNIHEYIFCYSKTPIKSIEANLSPEDIKKYKYKDKYFETRGGYITQPLATKSKDDRPNLVYPLLHNGVEIFPDKQWIWSKERMLEAYEKGWLQINEKNNKYSVRFKQYLKDENGNVRKSKPISILLGPFNQDGTAEITSIFGEKIFNNPKPTSLIEYLISMIINENEEKDGLYLDSFAGSGSTAQAVLNLNNQDGGNRRFILVELENDIGKNITSQRIKRIIEGYNSLNKSGQQEFITGIGSGFRYCNLSHPLFDKYGNVREGVKFKELARHIFFSETGSPLSEKAKLNTPKIGTYKGTAYYLLFNGILGDKSVNGGNVLTSKVLDSLPKHSGLKIIFGEANRLGSDRLKKENIIFKQIPYEIKTS
jgi:adenine specific DNA methylase Mod